MGETVSRVVGRPGVHVGVTDPRDRDPHRCELVGGHPRELVGAERRARRVDAPAAVVEHLRQRPRRLGTRDLVGREQFKLIGAGRVVVAQPHEPGDDLGPVIGGRAQADRGGRALNVPGDVSETELVNDQGVEPADRQHALPGPDRRGGALLTEVCGPPVDHLRERRHRPVCLCAGEPLRTTELVAAHVCHQSCADHLALWARSQLPSVTRPNALAGARQAQAITPARIGSSRRLGSQMYIHRGDRRALSRPQARDARFRTPVQAVRAHNGGSPRGDRPERVGTRTG